jgi:hypothetical protein
MITKCVIMREVAESMSTTPTRTTVTTLQLTLHSTLRYCNSHYTLHCDIATPTTLYTATLQLTLRSTLRHCGLDPQSNIYFTLFIPFMEISH